MVGGPVPADGGDDTERDADQDRDQCGENRELRRRRRVRCEVLPDGLVILERLAQVAVQQVRQVAPVLDRNRLVEPVALLERLYRRRIGRRLLTEIGGDRVAGHDLGECERDERDAEAEQDERRRAPEEKAGEGRSRDARESHGQCSIVTPPCRSTGSVRCACRALVGRAPAPARLARGRGRASLWPCLSTPVPCSDRRAMSLVAESVEARDVRVHIRGVKAVDGVDLTLRRGEILGVIGPNGAGKTTLVNVLAGFQRATTGRIVLNGEDITTWEPSEIARAGLVRTFQDVRLFSRLTVFENVEAGAVSNGASGRQARASAGELLARLRLEPRRRPDGRRAASRRAAAPRDRPRARGSPLLPPARRARRRPRRGRVGRRSSPRSRRSGTPSRSACS